MWIFSGLTWNHCENEIVIVNKFDGRYLTVNHGADVLIAMNVNETGEMIGANLHSCLHEL